jgi:hypothetical protein
MVNMNIFDNQQQPKHEYDREIKVKMREILNE